MALVSFVLVLAGGGGSSALLSFYHRALLMQQLSTRLQQSVSLPFVPFLFTSFSSLYHYYYLAASQPAFARFPPRTKFWLEEFHFNCILARLIIHQPVGFFLADGNFYWPLGGHFTSAIQQVSPPVGHFCLRVETHSKARGVCFFMD